MRKTISYFLFLIPLLATGQIPQLVLPLGHSEAISAVDFSPDGQLLFTGSNDKTGKLWDRSGRELATFAGHWSEISHVAFSPKGDQVLTSSYDFTASLWDLSGKELTMFGGHQGWVYQAIFSPDGSKVLTASRDSTAKLWDLSGEVITTFEHDTTEVHSVAFSPSGDKIITGGKNSLKVWGLRGKLLHDFKGQLGEVREIIVSPKGDKLISIGEDDLSLDMPKCHLNLWRATGERLFHKAGWYGEYTSAAFDPSGGNVLIGKHKGWVELWDAGGNVLMSQQRKGSDILATTFLADGPKVLTLPDAKAVFEQGARPSLSMWDLQGQRLNSFGSRSLAGSINHFTKEGHIYSITPTGQTFFWDLSNPNLLQQSVDIPRASEIDGNVKGDILWTITDKYKVQLWDRKGAQLAEIMVDSTPIEALGTTIPNQIQAYAAAPNQDRIVIGRLDGTISCWNFAGEKQFSFNGYACKPSSKETSIGMAVQSLRFSPDGKQVISTAADELSKVWDLNGKAIYRFPDSARINNFQFFPNGRHLITIKRWGEQDQIRIWDRSGKELVRFGGETEVESYTMSPDGKYIWTGDDNGLVQMWDWSGQELVRYAGHQERVFAIAISKQGGRIATMSDDGIAKLWDLKGRELLTLGGKEDQLERLFGFFKDDAFIATFGEGRIKFWSTETGDEVASLFLLDEGNWIATTLSGLFDASPGARQLMYYSLFYDGKNEVIDLDQLKARYYEPGLLQKLLGFSENRIRPIADFDTVKLYPQVIDPKIQNDQLTLQLKERNGGIGKVSIFINGKEVESEANLLPRSFEGPRYDSTISFDLIPFQKYLLRDSINTISIRVYNEEGWLKSRALNLEYQARAPSTKGTGRTEPEPSLRQRLSPKLYVVCIGTSEYAGDKLDLSYADQDAIMMAQALQLAGQALHRDSVEVHCLSTSPPPIDPALESSAIHWHNAEKNQVAGVFQAIRKEAKAEDVIVVYLSGHGVTRRGKDETEFYYLTQGVASEDDLSDPGTLSAYTISSNELTQWINKIPALKQVLIIDACNSGTVVDNLMSGTKALNSNQIRALDRMKDRTGLFILSGSASNKVSYEASEFGQGLLTYALLEGMRGRDKEDLDVMELFQYARDKVPELARSINGIQTPMLGFPRQGASFPIGLLPDTIKAAIPIGNKKPVMIRSTFLNKVSFKDDLGLTEKLDAKFRKMASKGARANLVYVDVNAYPGAYSITGLYDTSGEKVQIEVRLFQDNHPPITLQVESTTDIDKLVDSIIGEVEFKIY